MYILHWQHVSVWTSYILALCWTDLNVLFVIFTIGGSIKIIVSFLYFGILKLYMSSNFSLLRAALYLDTYMHISLLAVFFKNFYTTYLNMIIPHNLVKKLFSYTAIRTPKFFSLFIWLWATTCLQCLGTKHCWGLNLCPLHAVLMFSCRISKLYNLSVPYFKFQIK